MCNLYISVFKMFNYSFFKYFGFGFGCIFGGVFSLGVLLWLKNYKKKNNGVSIVTERSNEAIRILLTVPKENKLESLSLDTFNRPTELEANEYFTFQRPDFAINIFEETKHLRTYESDNKYLLLEFYPTSEYKDGEWQKQVFKAIDGWYYLVSFIADADTYWKCIEIKSK
jgi:hypothetical protein